jgi:hypothetical protein
MAMLPRDFSAPECATRSLLDFYRERIKKSKARPTKTTADHNIIISRFFLPGAAGGNRRMASAIIFLSSSLNRVVSLLSMMCLPAVYSGAPSVKRIFSEIPREQFSDAIDGVLHDAR